MEYRLHKWIATQNLRKATGEIVQNTQHWFKTLQDEDIIELLMTGFIPDTYEENGEEEKIFTKLIEVLVSEVFRRIGFVTTIVRTKSESEDVRISTEKQTILVDAKSFRLGRSQIAPNVKDFIKLHTIESWIQTYNQTHENQAIGGMVVYPSTHEWIKQSQVYKECSYQKTPVVMLSYEILCFLLQNKKVISVEDFLSLWNYPRLFPKPVVTRREYWNVIIPALAQILHQPVEDILYELEVFRLYYEESIKEAHLHLTSKIETISKEIPKQIQVMGEKEIRTLLEKLLIKSETSLFENSIKNILKNRKSFLNVEETHKKESGAA